MISQRTGSFCSFDRPRGPRSPRGVLPSAGGGVARHVRRDRRSALQAPFGYSGRSSWSRCHYGQQDQRHCGRGDHRRVNTCRRPTPPEDSVMPKWRRWDSAGVPTRDDRRGRRIYSSGSTEPATPDCSSRRRKTHETCWKKFEGCQARQLRRSSHDLATGQFCMADQRWSPRSARLEARATCTSMRLSPRLRRATRSDQIAFDCRSRRYLPSSSKGERLLLRADVDDLFEYRDRTVVAPGADVPKISPRQNRTQFVTVPRALATFLRTESEAAATQH